MATVGDVMTADPHCVDASATLAEAAQVMRDRDVGSVIVTEAGTATAIVTDRDIAVRAVADGRDPNETRVGDVSSGELATLSPDEEVGDAVRKMTDKDIRRLPVVEDGKPVGIVSLGDLAREQDPDSALADISASDPAR